MIRHSLSRRAWVVSGMILFLSAAVLVFALTMAANSPASAKKHKKDIDPFKVSTTIVQATGGSTANADNTATATCASGDLVTGGGYKGKVSGQEINATFPNSTTSWEVDYHNGPAVTTAVTAFAVCAHQS
jgi:hypothetical protein